jgi:cellulose biosynthesis protein BcsQ
MHAAATRRAPADVMPVIAVIGGGPGDERSIAALNFALACARDNGHVLLIDADHDKGQLSRRLGRSGKNKQHRAGWLGLSEKPSRTILTANGISILPAIGGANAKAPDLIRKTLAQARSAGSHKLAILDGPAMPWAASDLRLLDAADALIAVLPLRLDLDESMEEIITALGPAQDKLVGVILNELSTLAMPQPQGKQYA